MTASEKLLQLNKPMRTSKDCAGRVCVCYERCDVKNGMFLIGAVGRGETFEEACEDYLRQISGHTIVFNAESDNREEVKVLG